MLYDFRIPTAQVNYKGTQVMEVRGLAFNDVSYLVNRHRDDLLQLMDLWTQVADDFQRDDIQSSIQQAAVNKDYIIRLIQQAPAIVANAIALAADAIDQVDTIARYPVSIQIEALQVIGKLTADDFGGIKKLIGSIAGLAMANAPDNMRAEYLAQTVQPD